MTQTVPPAWVNAQWLKTHGPTDLCPPGFDRSLSDELVASYLRTATAGRAWFLESDGFGLAQRWHAKCVAESDFAAVQGNKTGFLPPAATPRPTASSPLFSQIASRWFDIAASVARCREYRAAPQLNASGLLDHTLIA